MDTILFVTNPPRRCGVYEYGKTVLDAMRHSRRYRYQLCALPEDAPPEKLLEAVDRWNPKAILFNWHPATMPWLQEDVLYAVHRRAPQTRLAAIVHDQPCDFHWIDCNIFNDPTRIASAREGVVGRVIPNRPDAPNPQETIIGSFGFGLQGKGFDQVIRQVNQEFEQATVRLHIPHSDYCDPDGSLSRRCIDECVALAKPGIRIEVTQDYKSREDLLSWLASNTVNCFFYDEFPERGISSVIDFALAARRPIAITRSNMFRHVANATPSIVIGESSLRQIIDQGIAPLRPFQDAWTEEKLAERMDGIFDCLLESTPQEVDLRGNRVLTPRDRQRLRPAIDELTALCPEMMARKFPEAVFQNAYLFQQAKQIAKPDSRIILIGGYEDPIGPALQLLGHQVTISDPQIDGRDSNAVLVDAIQSGTRYDLVISCSVIEHVEGDFEFVRVLYELLAPGGTALLSTDFRDGWHPGIAKPTPDVRLYSVERLRALAASLPPDAFPDGHHWQPSSPYFHYDQSDYGFCSIVLRKSRSPQENSSSSFVVSFLIQQLRKAHDRAMQLEGKLSTLTAALSATPTPPSHMPADGSSSNYATSRTVSDHSKSVAVVESILRQTRKVRLRQLEDATRPLRASVGLVRNRRIR